MSNLLTGQAKEDFISFMCKKYPHIRWHEYENMTNSMINALIIEWFDSVKYSIDRNSYDKNMIITDWTDGLEERTVIDCDYLNPFTEWYEEAITKANEIYNASN